MAKLTYLSITNRILKRIGEPVITDVTAATGNALIVTELINEAQIAIFNEGDWYSLYKTRTFDTVASTAEYALASDFGKGIDLLNETSVFPMNAVSILDIDDADPDGDETGSPRAFAIVGSNYRLYQIPDGVYTIRDRYYKIPDTLSSNTDESDLPIECENLIILHALSAIKEYKKEYSESDRYRLKFERGLKKAIGANRGKINKTDVFRPAIRSNAGRMLALFPSNYGRGRY